ncbi:MAG: hypothetical protein HY553_22520, partial [Elusimicrobia bacterium]|nr:hypothetical protein [Elusimicrobiota bacterium]
TALWPALSGRSLWTLAAFGTIVLLSLLLADHTRLPFLNERVRWATDWFPLPVPLDPPLLVRTEYLVTRLVDARYAFLLSSLCAHAGLLLYLAQHFGGRRVLVPVTLGYLTAVTSFRSIYFLNGAEAELPAAALGLIGLLETHRGRHVNALVAFTAGLLFKITAGFYAVPAIAIIVIRLARGRIDRSSLPWRAGLVALGMIGLTYVGYALNVVVLRGGSYVLQGSGQGFLLHSLGTFLAEFVTAYPVQAAVSVAAVALAPRRLELIALATSLLVIRSTVAVAGGYYTMFFVPLWALLACTMFVQLWEARRVTRRTVTALAALALLGNALHYAELPDKIDWMTRSNTGWDQRIALVARETPSGATVLFRKLSPRYDLERSGRHDMTFREMPEDTEASIEALRRSGPVLYLAPGEDIERIGPAALGYRRIEPTFGGASAFAFFLKSN